MHRPAPLVRDPDLPRRVVLAVLAGLAAGYFGYAIGSSRGLDLLEIGDLLGGLALVALGAALVFGVARLAMFQDWRPLTAAAVLFVALPVGFQASYLSLPGSTTDGTLIIDLPPLGDTNTLAVSRPGKCGWDDLRTTVTTVDSRRPAVRLPEFGQASMTAHVELRAEDGTMAILVAPPLGGEPVYRYSGSGPISRNDPTGRIGLVLVRGMARELVGRVPEDPDLAALLEIAAPPVASASVAWTCPPWPRL